MKHDQETHNAVDKKISKVKIRTVLWNKMKNEAHAVGTRGTVKCKGCGNNTVEDTESTYVIWYLLTATG